MITMLAHKISPLLPFITLFLDSFLLFKTFFKILCTDHFLKVFIESVTILLLFDTLGFFLAMKHLGS